MMTTDATAAFAELVRRPDEEIELDRAALLIAAHVRPDLDVDAERGRIDALAAGCEASLPGLLRHLFTDLGFAGNESDYDDPRNSLLDEVITRRTGLPITLSVLTIAVGKRLGINLEGVGFPGHYLVGVPGEDLFIDPFNRGRLLRVHDCADLLRQIAGAEAPFDRRLLAPAAHRVTLARILANLKNVYVARNDIDGATWTTRLRTLFPDSAVEEQAQLAALLAGRGHTRAAAQELDRLADRLPAARADRARHRAALLRASLN